MTNTSLIGDALAALWSVSVLLSGKMPSEVRWLGALEYSPLICPRHYRGKNKVYTLANGSPSGTPLYRIQRGIDCMLLKSLSPLTYCHLLSSVFIAVTHRCLILSSPLPSLTKPWYHSRVQYCLRYLFSSEKWIHPPITLEKEFYILVESLFNNISVLYSSYLTMFDSCMPQLLKSYFGAQVNFFLFLPHTDLVFTCWAALCMLMC